MATANRDELGHVEGLGEPILFDGQRLDQPTFHELYLRTPKHFRAELIEGVVHVMASPVRYRHVEFDSLFSGLLFSYSAETPGTVVGNNGTAKIDRNNELQPDTALMFLPDSGGQVTLDAKGYMVGSPELVVEVSYSSLTTDLHQKRRVYEAAGAQEYVVVDVEHEAIHWFARQGKHLGHRAVGLDGMFRSIAFPGLWLDARAYLRGDLRAALAVLRRGLASPEHEAFVAELGRRRANRP